MSARRVGQAADSPLSRSRRPPSSAAVSGGKDGMAEGPAMTSRSCDRDVITGPALIPTLGPEAAVDYKGPSESEPFGYREKIWPVYMPAQGKITLCRRVLWRTENELQSNIAASVQPAGIVAFPPSCVPPEQRPPCRSHFITRLLFTKWNACAPTIHVRTQREDTVGV
ncbi:unnamed protein product [Ranitomeya imitator]|uniref:Uncharacterized protein n=1 Tax=Ranitomeya imitator TaxID=111125 RepID=A0ABN9MFJ3_9NEOB|nr:unnamed protein product [Ranitomeya imitator]